MAPVPLWARDLLCLRDTTWTVQLSGTDRVLPVPEFPRYAMGLLHTSQAFGEIR